jgi:hypothetical protein
MIIKLLMYEHDEHSSADNTSNPNAVDRLNDFFIGPDAAERQHHPAAAVELAERLKERERRLGCMQSYPLCQPRRLTISGTID